VRAGVAGQDPPTTAAGGVRRVRAPRSRAWIVAVAAAAMLAGAAVVYVATRPSDSSSDSAGGVVGGTTSSVTGPTNPTGGSTSPNGGLAPKAFVIVTIDGVPAATEVSIAGVIVGVAPGPVQLPRGGDPMVLTFKVDGYLPQSRAITPDRDQRFAVALKKKGATASPPVHSRKDDILDPFGTHP
jgi:hypothetical protein